MGRKKSYSADEMIDAIEKGNGIIAAAARHLGCSRKTVQNYIKRYQTVKDAYEDASETVIDFAEQKLFENVKAGNMTAIIFLLKTKAKHRGYIERVQVENWRKPLQEMGVDPDKIKDALTDVITRELTGE